MRKIGIFGGTFDPVHKAHIAIAKTAKEQLGLDFVIMMTGGNPPHKRGRDILDAKLRHIMLKLAVRGEPGLIASDWEVNRKEYSYSVNTLRFFSRLYPDDKIYFIIGGDSLDNLDKWYMPEEICRLCTLAVYERGKENDVEAAKKKFGAEIVKISGEFMDISSSELRRNKELMKEYLPPAVLGFINKYQLYKERKDDLEILKRILKPQRLKHSIGVAEFAAKLAGIYGEDSETAYRAGLLHDAAKNIGYEESLVMCDELCAEIDPLERTMPPIVHPKLGAELVKCLFGLREGEITSAIRYHALGRKNMSLLEKIIFTADMCEEGRSFPGADEIRKTACENLDRAVVMCINSTIDFNIAKGNAVHPAAFAVRDWYMQNL